MWPSSAVWRGGDSGATFSRRRQLFPPSRGRPRRALPSFCCMLARPLCAVQSTPQGLGMRSGAGLARNAHAPALDCSSLVAFLPSPSHKRALRRAQGGGTSRSVPFGEPNTMARCARRAGVCVEWIFLSVARGDNCRAQRGVRINLGVQLVAVAMVTYGLGHCD